MWGASGLATFGAGTTYGVVVDGIAELKSASGSFRLMKDMYFSVTGDWTLHGGRGLCVCAEDYDGVFQVGGPIETRGRLRYINGCTDSLLLSPLVCGDPCLNFLHLPAGSKQAMHHHPSVRAGVVLSGHGQCITPDGEFVLSPGTGFVIDAHLRHAFRPVDGDLRVAAYHPDSDTGPTHEDHPMLNRTWVSDSVDAPDGRRPAEAESRK